MTAPEPCGAPEGHFADDVLGRWRELRVRSLAVAERGKPRPRRLGESDCEQMRDGLVHQPVNAWSSLAYVVVGCGLTWRARAGADPVVYPNEAAALGAILVATGFGSLAYHGPGTTWGQWLHDVPIVAGLVEMAVHDGGTALGMPAPARAATATVVDAGVGAALVRRPHWGTAVQAGAAVAAGAATTARHVRGRPVNSGALACLTAAVALNLLSRTGGPLCRPESRLQGHAAWHVLTALGFGAWARQALVRGE